MIGKRKTMYLLLLLLILCCCWTLTLLLLTPTTTTKTSTSSTTTSEKKTITRNNSLIDPFFTTTPRRMRLCHNPFTYNKRTKTDKMKLLFLQYEYNLSELNDNESVYTFNLKQSLLKNKYHQNYYNIVKLSITSSFVKRISTLRDVLVKWKKENMATYALVSSSTHVLVGSNTENLLTKLTQSRSVIVSSSLDDEFVAFGKLNDVVQLLDGILSHLKKHKESTVLDSVNAISTHIGNIHLDHSQDVIGHATTSNNDQHNIHHDMNWIMKTEETQDELGGGGLGRGYCLLFRYRNQECNSFSHPDVLLFSSSSSSSNKKGYNFLASKYLSAAPASNKFSTLYKRNSIRLVASLTSLPHRLENIDDTLNSLVSQHVKPDVIYLNIPKSYLRFGALPNLSTIARLRKKFSNKYGVSFVINMMEDDVGPLSKLLPTLYKEVDDDTLIITVDDDMIFKPTLFGILLQQHLNSPSMAYGASGQLIDIDDDNSVRVRTAWKWKDGSYPVDIIEGFTGAIYRRDFFDIDNVSEIPHVCRFTDDIWISSQLALKGIPRVKLALGWGDTAEFSTNDKITPLREDNLNGTKRNDACAAVLLSTFRPSWLGAPREYCPFEYRTLAA